MVCSEIKETLRDHSNASASPSLGLYQEKGVTFALEPGVLSLFPAVEHFLLWSRSIQPEPAPQGLQEQLQVYKGKKSFGTKIQRCSIAEQANLGRARKCDLSSSH